MFLGHQQVTVDSCFSVSVVFQATRVVCFTFFDGSHTSEQHTYTRVHCGVVEILCNIAIGVSCYTP